MELDLFPWEAIVIKSPSLGISPWTFSVNAPREPGNYLQKKCTTIPRVLSLHCWSFYCFFLPFFHLFPFIFPGNNSFHLVCPALMQSRSDPALMKCCYPESLSLVESGPKAITWLSSGKRHIYISYFIISLGCERGSGVLTRSISPSGLHHGEVIGKPVELSAK